MHKGKVSSYRASLRIKDQEFQNVIGKKREEEKERERERDVAERERKKRVKFIFFFN